MKTASLYADIVAIHPELRDSPRTHHETITEPLEYASGLANANIATDWVNQREVVLTFQGRPKKVIDNLPELTPGTFAKVRGVLRKAKTKSTLVQHRWHDPAGQSKTRRWNSSFYQHTPSLKDVERRHESASTQEQRTAMRRIKLPSLRQRLLREHGARIVRHAERLLSKPDAALLRGERLPEGHALRRFLATRPVPADLESICIRLTTLAKNA